MAYGSVYDRCDRVRGSFTRTVDPSEEPVTLAEAKLHLKVDTTADDTLITSQIKQAREKVESDSRRTIVESTYQLTLDQFPTYGVRSQYWDAEASIRPPLPPLRSVSSITYIDTDGTTATATTALYGTDTASEPGRIYLKNGKTWPTALTQADAVTVTVLQGTASTATGVPEMYKGAIKMLVGHWYDCARGVVVMGSANEVPYGYESIVTSLRSEFL